MAESFVLEKTTVKGSVTLELGDWKTDRDKVPDGVRLEEPSDYLGGALSSLVVQYEVQVDRNGFSAQCHAYGKPDNKGILIAFSWSDKEKIPKAQLEEGELQFSYVKYYWQETLGKDFSDPDNPKEVTYQKCFYDAACYSIELSEKESETILTLIKKHSVFSNNGGDGEVHNPMEDESYYVIPGYSI